MYTLEGLRHGIERCKHNVNVLTEAIENEKKTIREYKDMIASIEEAEEKKAEAEANVTVEVVRE
jgi:hypothetical protein